MSKFWLEVAETAAVMVKAYNCHENLGTSTATNSFAQVSMSEQFLFSCLHCM